MFFFCFGFFLPLVSGYGVLCIGVICVLLWWGECCICWVALVSLVKFPLNGGFLYLVRYDGSKCSFYINNLYSPLLYFLQSFSLYLINYWLSIPNVAFTKVML